MSNELASNEAIGLNTPYAVDSSGNVKILAPLPESLKSGFLFTMVTRTGKDVIENIRQMADN